MKLFKYFFVLIAFIGLIGCGDSGDDADDNSPAYPIMVTYTSHGKSSTGSELCAGCTTALSVMPDKDANYDIAYEYLAQQGRKRACNSGSGTAAQLNGCREYVTSKVQIDDDGTVTVISKEYRSMF